MERRTLGAAAVPVIGQGTWNVEKEAKAATAALRRGLDLGMTHIDTAEMYGSGRVEEIVGEAIAGRRDEVFLVSKVMPSNASFKGTLTACERSLKRLGTDRLDVYLLHWPGGEPLRETIRAFEKLFADGKIRAWGVSNFDVADLEEALAIAGPGKIACNQVLYHLEERAIEHEVIPWCESHSVAVVAYSPFGGERSSFPRNAALRKIASTRSATERQVALAFLTRRPGVFAIPKSSALSHVEENAAAGNLALTPAEISTLEAAFPAGKKRGLPTA